MTCSIFSSYIFSLLFLTKQLKMLFMDIIKNN